MADTNLVHIRHGSNSGQPISRRDGRLKVTGRARFASDNHPPGLLHAVMAMSTIARRQAPSRCRRSDDAGKPAAARTGSGRKDQPADVQG
jgi:CO/xanthine dehydrogenase Mo-binding subunit